MKSIFYITILLLCIAFSGCQKEPIDRNIEGMWRLEQFTTHKASIVPMTEQTGVKYYLDENRDYCVPKRSAEELARSL